MLLSCVTKLNIPQQTEFQLWLCHRGLCDLGYTTYEGISPEVLMRNKWGSVQETALEILVLNTKVRCCYCHHCHVTNIPTAMNHALTILNALLAPAWVCRLTLIGMGTAALLADGGLIATGWILQYPSDWHNFPMFSNIMEHYGNSLKKTFYPACIILCSVDSR